MYLIIDVGNTRVKAAVYQEDKLLELVVFEKRRIISEVKKLQKQFQISKGIISAVASISKIKLEKLKKMLSLIELSSTTKIPFKNLYKTPKTLGVDRIALVAAAVNYYSKKNVLVIDAGTCMTFDFVSKEKEYFGGAISPGIKIRYKALKTFTSKLPLLDKKEVVNFIGNTTDTSIHSGVVNGICREIEGVINQYKKQYRDLTVVLTGGDTNFLSKQLKSSIFANPNFVLEGLHTILNYNSKND